MRRLPLLLCALSALIVALPSSASATHAGDLDCSDFPNQSAAQTHLIAHPGDPDGLDGDQDGMACDLLACPCGATAAPADPPIPAPVPTPAPTPAPVPTTTPQPMRNAEKASARVVRVIDGDTLKVRLMAGQTRNVRLIGIDTPETRKPGTPVECGGTAATARMKKLALRNGRGRMVTLTADPTQDVADRYGRLLAYVSSAGVDFGRTMISAGWATAYVYQRDFQRVTKYRSAQASAKAARRGAWRGCRGDFHRAQ